ncbi:MAG: hypothetical protein HRT54_04375 [Colwellia sp.]|nr:hypothetical protein [Colwellia sp.]
MITNGFGLAINIDYKPLTDTSVYTHGEGAELLRQGSCHPIEGNPSCGMTTIITHWGYIKDSDNFEHWQASYICNNPEEITSFL